MSNKTLRQVTEEWVESQGKWIDDPLLQPAVQQLLLISSGIDTDPSKAALHGQFGLTFRTLMEFRPKEDPIEDELDILLRRANEAV
jgi:hypothetical protein